MIITPPPPPPPPSPLSLEGVRGMTPSFQPISRRLRALVSAVVPSTVAGLFAVFSTSAQAQGFSPPLCERTLAVQFAILVATDTDGGCTAFDPNTLQSITVLDLSGRSISDLKSMDFNGLDGVETLDLSGNRLESLPAGVFAGLTGLQTLNLSDNELRSLEPSAFSDVDQLRVLDLSHNRLEALPWQGAFRGLGNLRELNLEHNRLGRALRGNRFAELDDLRRLDLSDNRLQDLEADLLRETPKLKQLDLRNNRLEFLRANLFEGRDFNPVAVDGYGGSLLLSGNPGPDGDPETPFALVVEVRAHRVDATSDFSWVDFSAYLAQGAPFDVEFEWEVEGGQFSDPAGSGGSLSAGKLSSEEKDRVRHLNNRSDPPEIPDVQVSFTALTSLPQGDSGCGYSPCYDGFVISAPADDSDANCRVRPSCYRNPADYWSSAVYHLIVWHPAEVSDVRFVPSRENSDGYIPGFDVIVIEVLFDRRIVVVEGKPELVVTIGNAERRATYVPSEGGSDAMRFRYRLLEDDPVDADGIDVERIERNGATIDDMLVGHNSPDLDLADHGGTFPDQKVQRPPLISFDAVTVSVREGSRAFLNFTLDPSTSEPFDLDFSPEFSGAAISSFQTERIPAGASGGRIRVSVPDNDWIGRARETFTVSLRDSGGYVPAGTRTVTVEVEEGVCDRTPQVRDALTGATGRDGCAGVTDEDLADVVDLDLSSLGIERLSPRDFLGLSGLRGLDLRGNELRTLPAGIFEGLGRLDGASSYLFLSDNPGAPFDFVIQTALAEVESVGALESVGFRLYLAQGAPFDLDVRLNYVRIDPGGSRIVDPVASLFSFDAGDTRGEIEEGQPSATLAERDDGTSRSSLRLDGNLPSLPESRTGFGLSFEPEEYGFMTRGVVSVSDFEFTSRPQDAGGYAAGVETITAEVRFNDKLILIPSEQGGMPWLELRVGSKTRVASYVPAASATDVWTFTYALREDDADGNGIRVFSRDGLKLNGSTAAGLIHEFESNSVRLPDDADDNNRRHRVRQRSALSFDATTISAGEDSILELPFNVLPAARSPFVANYAVEGTDFAYESAVTVPAGSRRGIIRIPVGDGGETFEVRLTPSGGYFLFSPSRTSVTVRVGICDRTPQVQDALLSAIGKENCFEVTNQDLAGVDNVLDLNDAGVTSLRSKDFSGLTNLARLLLNNNRLQSLPSGLFEGLSNLGTLELRNNQLQSLRRDAFSGLGKLNRLRLQRNRLSSLPSGVFSGVGRLSRPGQEGWWLFLSDNPLSSLPPGVFSGTDGLEWLRLGNNAMTELPAGIFSGISESLRALVLDDSGRSTFRSTLRFEFAGGADMRLQTDGSGVIERVPVKLTLREGAAYRLRGDLRAEGGSASVSVVEIPPGATQSETFEVFPANAPAFVMWLDNPSPPPENCLSWQRGDDGRCFSGLEIVAPAPFTLNVTADTSVCDRPQAVQDALIQLWSGSLCRNFPTDLLRTATYLDLSDANLSGLTSADFAGMESLERLDLSGSAGLQALEANAFGELSNLKRLDLSSMGLRTLDPRAFAGLESLEQLLLHDNDLRELPAGIFSGLSGLGAPSGSLRVEGNPDDDSPYFVLPTAFRVAQVAGDALDFYLYLAQGAPLDLSFPLTAEGASPGLSPGSSPGSSPGASSATFLTVVIPAGSTRSEILRVNRASDQTLRLSFGDPPSLAQANPGVNSGANSEDDSGCGYAPCYAGFEIALGPPLVYDGTRQAAQVTAVEFSAPRYFDDGYVAGMETMTVDVIFDKALMIDTSGGVPSLRLQVGSKVRRASYLPGRTDVDGLRFSYALASDDVDEDGVSVVSDGLELNGATMRDAFSVAAALSLARFVTPVAERQVHRISRLSFETSLASFTEGTTAELTFRLDPPTSVGLTVGYRVGAPGDTADADDYIDAGSGDNGSGMVSSTVTVEAGATRGTVLVSIRDDEEIEPAREFFTVSLFPSDDYFVASPSTLRVVIAEGVCDRTPKVREALTPSRFSGCAAATEAYLSSRRRLDLSSTQITAVKRGDFSGLTGLQELRLNGNFLRVLPEGVFSGLTGLQALHLGANPDSPFSVPLRIELAGGPQSPLVAPHPFPVRLTLRHGAPFAMDVGISMVGGGASSETVLIAAGSTQSETFLAGLDVTGDDWSVTLSVSPPNSCALDLQRNGRCFTGFEITSNERSFPPTPGSPDSAPTVCGRTPGIRDAILRLPGSPAGCADFPFEALGFAAYLDASNVGLSAISRADLVPMIRLQRLDLSGNPRLQALGESVFADLGDLKRLDLSSGGLQELHPRTFAGLGSLEQLLLQDNDLQTLPAGIFEGLTGLGSALGSLRLENNGSSSLTLTVQLKVAGASGDDLEFYLYLPQGAPFNLRFPLTATGSAGSVPSTMGISAGSTWSKTVRVTRASGQELRLSLGDPPPLPQGDLGGDSGGDPGDNSQSNSGCGYVPCYAGFEIASGEPLVYSGASSTPQVTGVEFSTSRYFDDAYLNDRTIPGAEAFTVEVVFDRELNVDTSDGEPELMLEIAGAASTATYTSASGSSGRLRFSYTIGCRGGDDCDGDVDEDGVRVNSANALRLNGAVVTDAFGTSANPSLADVVDVAGPKVRPGGLLRFDVASVEVVEGETFELGVTASRAAVSTSVTYVIGAFGDTAEDEDYSDVGGGAVSVFAGERNGTIRISIRDDEVAEPTRESFTVSLSGFSSDAYFLASPARVVVTIKEGVCDRTPQVRDALTAAFFVARSCTDVTSSSDVGRILFLVQTAFNLSSMGIMTLKEGDFSDLSNLRSLRLDDNDLRTLPAGIFAGLDLGSPEGSLHLHGNPDAASPDFVFTVEFRFVRFVGDQAELVLYLPQGAPFDVTVPLIAEGALDSLAPSEVTIPAGEVQSARFRVGRQAEGAAPLRLGAPVPALLPRGGCGAPPCYSGFRIAASETPFIYDDSSVPRVERVEFTSTPQYLVDGYIAGVETVVVEVVFDRELLVVDVAGGEPSLTLQVGETTRTATYAPTPVPAPAPTSTSISGVGNKLRFSYALAREDLDADGLSVASARSLRLNGATVTGHSRANVDASLARFVSSPAGDRKVHRSHLVSFGDSGPVTIAEGDQSFVPFIVTPAPLQGASPDVGYGAGRAGDTADAGDYRLETGSTVVRVDGAETRYISVSTVDDQEIGPLSKFFTLYLTPPASGTDYVVTSPSSLRVTISEGVCDRTPAVRDVLSGRFDCAAITDASLARKRGDIQLYDQGITSLLSRDFSGLVNLRELGVDGNSLQTLPEGVFAGLGELNNLYLSDNQLQVLRTDVFAGLSKLSRLELNDNDLRALPEGVFAGLGGLTRLFLYANRLQVLPADVFAGLGKLSFLELSDNDLRALPEGVFAGLGELTHLYLRDNQLQVLPADVFAGLGELEVLYLNNNPRLSKLPPGLFSDLGKLEYLSLHGNGLSELPPGIFAGLSNLKGLRLDDNPGSPFALALGLEVVDQSDNAMFLRATLREGAPYRLQADLKVTGGGLSHTLSMEIPAGSTRSETHRTFIFFGLAPPRLEFSGVTAYATNGCASQHRRPRTGECFSGLEIDYSARLVLDNTAVDPPICDRTPGIRDAILALRDGDDCASFPAYALRVASRLDASAAGLSDFKPSDFNDMDALERLDLSGNAGLQALGANAFGDGLTRLKHLDLSSGGLDSLHPRAFAGLSGLEQLLLHDNDIASIDFVTSDRDLPAGIFAGLSGLGSVSGSLRLEDNPDDDSSDFVLTAAFRVVSAANDELEFYLYLAQGAPFEVSFPLIAQGSTPVFAATSTVTIPAGSTHSETLSVTRQTGHTLRLSLGDPSLPPQSSSENDRGSKSGCGYAPCYAGFEITSGGPLIYEGGAGGSPSAPQATTMRFSSPRYPAAGYVAGVETVFVDVVFDRGLIVDTSGGVPSLRLLVGDQERRADYLPGQTADDVLRFSYVLAAGDLGEVSIASASGLELNDATVLDALGVAADLSLPDDFLTSVAARQVVATYLVSFDVEAISTEEIQTTLRLPFTVAPPVRSALSVGYHVGAPGDTADGGDYAAGEVSGTVMVGTGETRGHVPVSIRDDEELEPPSEFFTVSLSTPTGSGYILVSPSVVKVEITERGICDRTRQVREGLVNALGATDCAVVTERDLAEYDSELDLAGTNLSNLKRGDFFGLGELEILHLQRNRLTTLPADAFDGLGGLRRLNLRDNELTTLPTGAFDGLGGLEELDLHANRLTTLSAGTFDGLGELRKLLLSGNERLATLPEGTFDSLGELRELILSRSLLTTLPAGTFDGLGELRRLWLHRNRLTTLPAGTFDGLGELRALWLHRNQLTSLPKGAFRGLSNLTALHLGNNPGADFELAVALEPAARATVPGELSFRATLRDGAPYLLQGGVVVSDAEISGLPGDVVTIPAGEARSEAFLVSPTGRSPTLRFIALSPPPDNCETEDRYLGQCFSGFTIDWGNELSLDDGVPPSVSGVTVEAGKEIVVRVHFSEGVFVIPGSDGLNPTLSLEIGGEERTAVYDEDLSSGDTLAFRYTPRSDDEVLVDVVVPDGALDLNGASITDLADNSADLSYFGSLTLDDYSVQVSAPGNREVSVVFSPDVVDVAPGSSVAFTLGTVPALLPGESAMVTLAPSPGIFLNGAGNVLTLHLDGETMQREEVRVSMAAGTRSGLVTAAWRSFVGFEPQPPRSSLVVNPVSVTFTPDEVDVEQGDGVTVTVTTMPELSPGQSATVVLTAQAGLSFGGGESVLTLRLDGATTRREVRVEAGFDAPPGDTGITSALSGNGFGAADEQALLSVNVTLRVVSVSVEFDVAEAVLTVSDATEVALRLGETSGLYPGEALDFVVTTEGSGLGVAPQGVSLTESGSATVLVFARTPGVRGTLTVTSARPSAVRLGEATLPVRVERDLRLSFDPAEVSLTAGGSSEFVELTLERDDLLEPGETVVVTLTPSPGLEVRSESGESLSVVSLGRDAGATTRVRVSANRDADYVTPDAESLNAAASVLPDNVRVAETTLSATVEQREIRVSFEPRRITLVRGGAAPAVTSRVVTMRTEPELQSGEALVVSLSATGVAVVSPPGPVTLTPTANATAVTVEATQEASSGAVFVTLDENASLFGNARVTTDALAVAVVRGVSLSLLGHAGQDLAQFVAGESTEVRVTTDPVLEGDERVRVTLSVDPRLSLESAGSALIDGNVLVLTATNQNTTVGVTTKIPELDLSDGVSASGAGENVGVVGAASLRVRTETADEVTVVLSPLPVVEIERDGSTTLRITTDPQLGMRQITTVYLVIEPDDAGLSFVAGGGVSSNTTVRLGQGRPFLDVEVAAGSDAVIGSTARVTSTVLESSGVEAVVDGRSRVTLETTTPRAALRFTPTDVLSLNLGTSVTASLSLRGFTLVGNQTVVVEVSVEGEGLRLAGGVKVIREFFVAGENTTPISVAASSEAASIGRLVAEVISGGPAGGVETTSLPIEVLQATSLSFNPAEVRIPRSRSTRFEVALDPPLVADRKTTVSLVISEQGFSFGGDRARHEIVFDADKSSQAVVVEATAAIDAMASVSVDATATSGVALTLPPGLVLKATTPRVVLGLTPAGGVLGDVLRLNTGTDKAVTLSLPDLRLSDDHVVEFELSVEGEGLGLQGGTPTLRVRLSAAAGMTTEISVTASAEAASVGRLMVRAVGGVELAGDAETASLPIEVLQETSLGFNPTEVRIQRGRSTRFEVALDPPLVADRKTTVILVISDQGFSFLNESGIERGRRVVAFEAGETTKTVSVRTTAAIDSTVLVSVDATATSGVALTSPPGLVLKATPPRVAVTFDPPSGLRLTENGTGSVTIGLKDYSPIPDQAVELSVAVQSDSGDLKVSTDPSMDGDSMVKFSVSAAQSSATVIITAGSPGTGVLRVVSDDVELTGDVTLPITVEPREIRVFFEPSRITLVRGGAAPEATLQTAMMRTEPELQSGEALVVELSATGVAVVSPTGPVTLTPADNATAVTVEATREASSGAVFVTLDANASSLVGSARVTTDTLAVTVVRGVNLSLFGSGGQAVATFVAGESTEVGVATSPLLAGAERVTVTLSVDSRLSLEGAGSALIDGNVLVLSAMNPSATVRVTTKVPGLDLSDGVSASGSGESVVVFGAASLRVRTEAVDEVAVALLPSPVVEVEQGGGTTLRVTTEPQLAMGQVTTVYLVIEPDDAGLGFVTGTGGSSNTTVRLGRGRPFLDVEVAASSDAAIGSTVQVTSTVVESSRVEAGVDDRSRVILKATTPRVILGLTPTGGVLGDVLRLNTGTDKAVTLSLSDLRLSGSRTAVFEVSVEGEGLRLSGGVKMIQVSFAAGESTTEISVSASAEAVSVGRLVVRAVGDVELAGGAETASLPIEVLQETSLGFNPPEVRIQRGRSTRFEVVLDPSLVADRKATVILVISGQGFSFLNESGDESGEESGIERGRRVVEFEAGETMETVSVKTTAAIDATVSVSVDARATSGVALTSPPALVLKATTPRVVLGFMPSDALELNLGETAAVQLSMDFTLSGSQTAEFEVSVEGEGLSLQGGTPIPQVLEVSLDAVNVTAGVTVTASDSAVSIGELSVRALSGVELAGDAETTSLPIEVLQSVSLSFVPDLVEIQQGRSTQFEVRMSEPLVADRMVTVTLTISEEGFSFDDAGRTQHEVTFDAGKSRETVTVTATAAIDSMMSVEVGASTSSGVDLAPLPGLMLKATTPRVSVAFSPAGELRLPSGGAASVELSLADYSLAGDQAIVLGVLAEGEGLEVSPPSVTLTATSPTAAVQVSASRRAKSGNLVVSADSGAALVGGSQSLPVVVVSRQLAVSFEPSAVRLVRGVAAAEMASTEVSLSVTPALEGDERLVLELTSGAGNLEVNPPEATLSSMARTVLVTVTVALGAVSTEVVPSEKSGTSIGNAEVSFTPLTVEVVRGVELSLSDHAGQAVEMVTITAGESTDVTVATEPSLEGDERVTVTLSVADGLALVGENELILTATDSSIQVQLSAPIPDLDLPSGLSASGEGENVVVVGEAPSLRVVTESSSEVAVVLPAVQVAVQQGSSAMLRVETSPQLATGQSVTVRLTMEPDDAGLSFADGSSVTDVRLGETGQSVDVAVFASPEAAIGSSARVTSIADASVGLDVVTDGRSGATLVVAAPQVTLGLTPAGGALGEALTLNLKESRAVELSLTGFTLSGNQTAVFEVSVEGEGLMLEGDASSIQVSFVAGENTKSIPVTASADAASVGRLVVRPVGGVELAGDAEAMSLPIGVLQSVELVFDPAAVEIQRGRSTQFEVRTSEPLVADRMVTVTLAISEQGFTFGGGNTQHEVVLDAGKSRETVTVEATAAEGLTAQVSVVTDRTPGVDLASPLPSLSLTVTEEALGVMLRIRVFLEGALE